MKVTKICGNCKKEFSVYPYRKNTARYCSIICKNKSPEQRKMVSFARKAQVIPQETREKISQTLKEKLKPPVSVEFLEKIYFKKGYSFRDIERIYGWKNHVLSRWFKKLGITPRKKSYWHKEECYRRKLQDYQYGCGFTENKKDKIRKRDNYACQLCGKRENNRRHSVHHIDYNKKNNNPNNLITTCVACHAKTNFERPTWTRLFNQQLGLV